MLKQIENKQEKKLVIQNLTLYFNRRSGHLVSVNGFTNQADGLYVIYVDYHREELKDRLRATKQEAFFQEYNGGPLHVLYDLPTTGGNNWSNPRYQ